LKQKLSPAQLKVKSKLNYHYKYFDFKKISPDPLEFPHRFSNYYDIEISSFLSSVFAYGNVSQIINTLKIIHDVMEENPHKFILEYSEGKGLEHFKLLKHRFYTPEDINKLFLGLQKIYTVYGSLKYLFLLYYFEKDSNLKESLSFFSNNILNICADGNPISHGLKFMFPDSAKGSACKRFNLFLRWMVRKDDLDFGLWFEIDPGKLIIPVDTHVAAVSKKLRLTKSKVISWKMAEEITKKLKLFDPKDPVKYDFAICHIGMRKMKF
jgi:uncharacterized protein (TIGR02757 family)